MSPLIKLALANWVREEPRTNSEAGLIATVGVPGAVTVAGLPLLSVLKREPTGPLAVTPERAAQLLQELSPGIDLRVEPGVAAQYRPTWLGGVRPKGTILMPTPSSGKLPLDVLLHELGHSDVHAGPSRALRALGPLRALGQVGGLGFAGLAPLAYFTEMEEGRRDKLMDWASIAGGTGGTPMLIDEALASIKALKHLDTAGRTGRLFGPVSRLAVARSLMRKRLLAAFGTYGLTTAGAVAAPQVAKWWAHRDPQ